MIEYGYDKLKSMLQGRHVVYVPVVSCIDRETGLYNLDCDGNVNRMIATFDRAYTAEMLSVILPTSPSTKVADTWAASKRNVRVSYVEGCHGLHAKDQRVNAVPMYTMLAKTYGFNGILYVVESQTLAMMLLASGAEVIYFCPVCNAGDKSRSFTKDYSIVDKNIWMLAESMIVCSPDQVEEFGSEVLFCPVLADGFNRGEEEVYPEYDEILFLPYRLTDEGYDLPRVLETISSYKEAMAARGKKVQVVYTDPNNSKTTIEGVKASTDRDTYYKMLASSKVTVIYLEDLNFVNHAALWEFNDPCCNARVVVRDDVDFESYGLRKSKFTTYTNFVNSYSK